MCAQVLKLQKTVLMTMPLWTFHSWSQHPTRLMLSCVQFSGNTLLEIYFGTANRIRFSAAVDSIFSVNAYQAVAFPSEAVILLPLPVSEKQQHQQQHRGSNRHIESPVRLPDMRIPHDNESPHHRRVAPPPCVVVMSPTQQH